ncbi:MAG: 16S rRNA (cytosine(1402)-N(4))-methyltransferase RsmH [Aquiluna sp.]|jgi:16S rRNA (cytosine1402-N4)-methyltransferase
MEIQNLHRPVMLDRCLELLRPGIVGNSPVVVDATLGLGGHTEALLIEHPNLTVIGFDRDPVALELASERLSRFGSRFHGALATYDKFADVLNELSIQKIQGALFDLGVSSMQLDQPKRGFAYAQDAPLDMRMDQSRGLSAAEVLADASESELIAIFRDLGEERFAPAIARAIVKQRTSQAITTSAQLNAIVERVVPKAPGKQSGHPAKRVYQALRIFVNDELAILTDAIPQAIDALATGARIVVMSYHSLEDAIVKSAFQKAATSSTPIELPVELPGSGPRIRVITKGVERATEIELTQNPRAASARLRAAEKLEAA